MKRLIILLFLALLVLTACGTSHRLGSYTGEVVCAIDFDFGSRSFHFESENGEITSVFSKRIRNIDGWSDEEVQETIERNADSVFSYDITDDTLSMAFTFTLEDVLGRQGSLSLEEFVADLEENGMTCSIVD